MTEPSIDFSQISRDIEKLEQSLKTVIKGKDEVIELFLVALLANGHILLEDVPGVGKTTLAKSLAKSVDADFCRIQFTPDLLPSDVSGTQIFNPNSGELSFHEGPIFTNILLADEINRASPRTQSALLEAMSESQVTINGKHYDLAHPFLVIATQNPVEYHGTYPLPEAQLDRFSMQLHIDYPNEDAELELLRSQLSSSPLDELKPCLKLEDIISLHETVTQVELEESVTRYLLSIIRATREHNNLQLGASPRASLSFSRCCQALALMRGRHYVLPDDIQELAIPCLAHRIILGGNSRSTEEGKQEIIQEILNEIQPPR